MSTPVRDWILNRLNSQTKAPVGTDTGFIWSDNASDEPKFIILTGTTHVQLMAKWYAPFPKDQKPDHKTKGSDPNFTTCTSFLSIMNTKIREAGGLPKKYLDTMVMNTTEKTHFVKADSTIAAKPGDFFLTKYTKNTVPDEHKNWVGFSHHVGIIYEVSPDGNMWSQVAGGSGGRNMEKDGVSRKPLQIKPEGLVGWLDIDLYYAGWVEKNTRSSGRWEGPSRMV